MGAPKLLMNPLKAAGASSGNQSAQATPQAEPAADSGDKPETVQDIQNQRRADRTFFQTRSQTGRKQLLGE